MAKINRLRVVTEANALAWRIWKSLPHTANNHEIKRQFSGILSAHIDTFEIAKTENDKLTSYWEFVARAGKEFSLSNEDIKNIKAYVNYEIDELDIVLPHNTNDKVYILYGLINVVMINGLPQQENMNIPEFEITICTHFEKLLGFKAGAVLNMIEERKGMENKLAM